MADEKRAVLLGTFMGMVLSMCRQLGLTDDETVNVFSAKNIRAGFDILDKKEQP